jgi:KDO2-lipid IV(A) lauroyltransferase
MKLSNEYLPTYKRILKEIRYFFEAIIVYLVLIFFRLIGLKNSSNLAAKISLFIGSKLRVNQLAKENIKNALPEIDEKNRLKIISKMWENLGRIVGEYYFVCKFSHQEIRSFVSLSEESIANLEEMKKMKKGGIIFSGHIGNWELGPKAIESFGLKVATVYRPLNNKIVEKITASIRSTELIAKSNKGNKRIIEILKKGGFVIILADQKTSEGEAIKFFHKEAITTTSIARFALRYSTNIIPARINRIGDDFKFKVEIEKPLEFTITENPNHDLANITLSINQKLESWIREFPAQWFWVHNRWKN